MLSPLDLAGQLAALSLASDRPTELSQALDDLLAVTLRTVPSCLAVSLSLTAQAQPVTVTALAPAALLQRPRCSLTLKVPQLLPVLVATPDRDAVDQNATADRDAADQNVTEDRDAVEQNSSAERDAADQNVTEDRDAVEQKAAADRDTRLSDHADPGGPVLVVHAAAAGALDQLAVDAGALLGLESLMPQEGEVLLPLLAGQDYAATLPDDPADRLLEQLGDRLAVDRAVGVLLDRGLLPAQGREALELAADERHENVPAAARRLLDAVSVPSRESRPD